jgi:2-isopropylmalate synthase
MDAMGQVSVIIESEGRIFHGMGLATDIILSSARAIAHAANEVRRSEQVQQHKLQSADINRAAI